MGTVLRRVARGGSWVLLGMALSHCASDIDYPAIAFLCHANGSDQCPRGYSCCSDDAAHIDGALLFAGANNDRSHFGLCILDGAIPIGAGLGGRPGCPTPCDPTATPSEVASACGSTRVCCQTIEIDEADCIHDGTRFVPMDGSHAVAAAMAGEPGWGRDGGTHQDPDFRACEDVAGSRTNPAFFDCVSRLTTAAQRGICIQLGPGQGCPGEFETFIDACEQLNMGA